jgi:two-component system response regulator AtoC
MSKTERFSCLVVDDDAGFAAMLARLVSEEGGKAVVCHTLNAAKAQVVQRAFDLIILDNGLPDGTGFEFYPQVARKSPASIVAMITGTPELSQAVELTRNGLFDYLTKPLETSAFVALLHRAKLRLRAAPEPGPEALLGNSAKLKAVAAQLQQAARHAEAAVLLLGETGTGKDLAARHLHQLTYGAKAETAPYVALNCANVPAEMFEAELFGSEKGAYTGAERRRTGLVEAAEGGTLFLDEVAEIPLGLQPKLLRFLESREYRTLGGTEVAFFNGRVIAATNRSLAEEARAGRLREDLMYRLDVVSVRLPPLREHLEDLEAIARGLLDQLCRKYGRTPLALKEAEVEALRAYPFPGNVRELRNVLERSLLKTDSGAAELAMDLEWLRGRSNTPLTPRGEAATRKGTSRRDLSPVEQQEYDLIASTLASENGGIRRTAAKLGLTHQALLRRLQKWPELRQTSAALE